MDWLNVILSGESAWGWLALGAILFALDVTAPGFYLVWFAIASAATGMLLFALPLANPWPLVAFCVFSLLSLFAGRMLWGSHREIESDRPLLNQRGRQLIGQTFVLSDAIVGGRGRMKAGDSVWTVTGPNLPAGQLVRVKNAEGTILTVEAAETSPSFPKAGSFFA
jgi:membrane protein implicated in regulation of membrane protease activity